MELPEWEIDEYVETEGIYRDFTVGNGHWWQNSFYFEYGYGFGFVEDFGTIHGNYHYPETTYPFNLLFNI